MRSRTPSGNGKFGSASIPKVAICVAGATAEQQYPMQCAILPTAPWGHSGSPLFPRKIGPGGNPNTPSAARAHDRPAVNSLSRILTVAGERIFASSGSNEPMKLPRCSTPTADTGNILEILLLLPTSSVVCVVFKGHSD